MTETVIADTTPRAADSTGMAYLNTLPRRLVTVYTPLAVFMIVLLFPFYWMAVTTFKPNDELYNLKEHSPFLIKNPTFANVEKLLFHTNYPDWLLNTMIIAVSATALSIFANVWRGVPFIAITLLAGLQTVSPSLYEAATLDGATPWQRFRHITYPLLTPIIAVVMTFSVLFTFTDFQLIWVLTKGGPVNATQLMATLSYQRAIIAGHLGEGAAISSAMIPFLLGAILISWFGLQRRKWQQGEAND